MSYHEVLSQHSIAISASDSPDMPALGLGQEHLKDAMAEIARHLLALGARLCYGGDLRANGFSQLLFEFVQRHKRDVTAEDTRTSISNFLPWPEHLRMPFDEIKRATNDLTGVADLVILDESGTTLSLADRQLLPSREPSGTEWTTGLTAMRKVVNSSARAKLVLGGRVDDYKGSMPGVAEEALISLHAGTPLYLVGGFGGCTRDIAETLCLTNPWAPLNRTWHGRSFFQQFTPDLLNNGLTLQENQVLARTPHVEQAVALILKGLVNIVS